MHISFESKGDFNIITKWLNRVSSKSPLPIAKVIAKQGEQSLMSKTPMATGETAMGWRSEITTHKNSTEILWYNTAHPQANVSVAKLIELGHGTGTGGYVPPRPYIKEAMRPVWSAANNRIDKEMIK